MKFVVRTWTGTAEDQFLGDTPEHERPLEATLWGAPPCGRAAARLADGTVVRWTRGKWTVTPRARHGLPRALVASAYAGVCPRDSAWPSSADTPPTCTA